MTYVLDSALAPSRRRPAPGRPAVVNALATAAGLGLGITLALEALQLQGDDPRSVQISSYAAPILQQEVLEAQSAAVDPVSGATYTSASYEQSLQSALDKLNFNAPRATLQVP